MNIALNNHQLEAIEQIKNGSVLCGGVGSGKSRTALAYYILKVGQGRLRINGSGKIAEMKDARDLYIITTAKKRDDLEWEKECGKFVLFRERENSISGVKVTVDSWNNIRKYKDVYGAFFIFDEQRVVGTGVWVKTFLNIARKNKWILLSATPGDTWSDYIPLFVANGFFRNKTDFQDQHCVFSRFSKYPRIEKYIGEEILEKYRDQILVPMKDDRRTMRHDVKVICDYDQNLYKVVFRNRWDPWEKRPIEETGKLLYLTRKVVNYDWRRIQAVEGILAVRKRCIIFYNFDYELEMLLDYLEEKEDVKVGQWNGHRHDEVPDGESWVYLVQFNAGAEGWNCTSTDTIIFFSQNYSYRMVEQASGRIDRIDSPYFNLYYYHLRSNSPIDLAIYRALKNKRNFNERRFLAK